MTERKKPTPLSEALSGYLERSGIAERIAEAAVVPDWESRVGEAIAGVTDPLRVSNGTLFVAVESSAWLMELRLMESEILQRINAGRDRGKIDRIRFLMSDE